MECISTIKDPLLFVSKVESIYLESCMDIALVRRIPYGRNGLHFFFGLLEIEGLPFTTRKEKCIEGILY